MASKTALFEPVDAHEPKANANENGPSPKVRNWPARRCGRRRLDRVAIRGVGLQAVDVEGVDAVGRRRPRRRDGARRRRRVPSARVRISRTGPSIVTRARIARAARGDGARPQPVDRWRGPLHRGGSRPPPAASIARPAAASPAARASTARRPGASGIARARSSASGRRRATRPTTWTAGGAPGSADRCSETCRCTASGGRARGPGSRGCSGRPGLVEPVAVAARVEAEQAADEQADRRLVRHHRDVAPGCVTTISRITGSARASTFRPDSPPSGANVNGSASQAAYSSANASRPRCARRPSQRP